MLIAILKYRELIKNLVLKDLKLKYRDSVLGLLWSLANPLLLILVYSFVFGHILRGAPQNFAYFLMVGILPWNLFAQSLSMSTGSILDNGALIRKVALPLEVFPVATVLFNLAQFLLALAIFFPMAIFFFKVPIAWSWLLFFPILALQILFMLGLCLMVSTVTVYYRDMRHFTEILLMLLFWLTPIIYDIRTVPEGFRAVLFMNPFSYFILAYQDTLFLNHFPVFERLAVIVLLTVVSLGLGYKSFFACKIHFAEEA
jgi:lipopolysaccharide transport system permease protein